MTEMMGMKTMTKKAYTDKFYTYNSKYISNALALRVPQHESLEIFARLCEVLSLKKNTMTSEQIVVDNKEILDTLSTSEEKEKKIHEFASEYAAKFYENDLKAARTLCPTLTSFERDFPSVCFALATGIGKTRLMGACIAYLHYEKGINNFFVMAPNLTIYNKLKSDLSDTTSPKYVFKGLDKFINSPIIIDGDNYESFRQGSLMLDNIVVNIFNISKLNSDSKVSGGSPARIKRLNEILGESYFSYLQSLEDLCIFMDESHHYHADKSFEVINELRPILGVELTATPQVQKGSRKIDFKNVVYEYTLAHALNDEQYVKVPVVFTRKDFRAEEYTSEQLDREKLIDGIRIHEETKSDLEVYARTHGKKIVKPFVLVVAKDTEHSRQIMSYLKSDDFFKGYYKDKVMEINSAQRGAEKDENIIRLLSLEDSNNKIEIVIHVNMLKEGWDITNLYTIVPLRASASETLTEQTIGRGLRLPYGERTGVDKVDRLSIVSHDKYKAIVDLANSPDSLVRKVYYIDETVSTQDEEHETVELPAAYDEITLDKNNTEELALTLINETPVTYESGERKTPEQAKEISRFIAEKTSQAVIELNKQVTSVDATKDEASKEIVKNSVIEQTIKKFAGLGLRVEDIVPVVSKIIETCVQALTDKVIPIPQTVIQPFITVKQGFYDFELNANNMNWHPSDDTLIGTELQSEGETFELNTSSKARDIVDTPENEIVRHLIIHDDVDYGSTSELLFSLVDNAKKHFMTYLTESEAEKVMRDRQKTIADIIYSQMREHFYRDETTFKGTEMRPFSRIEGSFGGKFRTDEIYDLRATVPAGEVKSKIFNGFTKACHTLYKFDSNTERIFAIVLENDSSVLRWLRPAPKQFNIYWGSGGYKKYEPDFIVETATDIYMVETKASNEIQSKEVLEKAKAAKVYCAMASDWNKTHDGKPWTYALISHDEVRINSSFKYLVANRVPSKQLELDFE